MSLNPRKSFYLVTVIGLLFVSSFVLSMSTSSAEVLAPLAPETQSQVESSIFIPAIYHRFDASLGPPPFGVQMYGNTRQGTKYFEVLVSSKANWIRTLGTWTLVEPTNVTPDQYRWSSMDSTVAAARDAGVEVILTIQGAPEWASNNERGVIDIAPLSEFAEFMGALAERYDSDGDRDAPGSPRVRYFEMYNEPDLQYKADGTGGWGNHGKEYADMLKAIYPAVKEANPDARVTFGGIVYDTWTDDFFPGDIIKSFLTDVLDNGGGEYFDVMNYHAYPGLITRFDPGGGVGLKQKTDVMRGILANYNLQDLPIIITETGMHANSIPNFPSSPEIQANHLVKLFVQGMVVDIDALIWFSLYDPLPDYPLFNGLVSDDAPPVPRLALTTMQTLVDLMQTTRYVRTLDIAETGSDKMEAYQFFDTTLNRTIYIAWMNPINTTETHALLLSGGRADVIDVQANTQTIEDNTDGNVDGKVTVTVGDSPIFVVIR